MNLHEVISKKNIVYPTALGLVILMGLAYKYLGVKNYDSFVQGNSTEVEVTATENVVSESVTTNNSAIIQVYICGAVNEPGVYEIKYDSILYDVVQMAGGLREDAATEHINLVMGLKENVSIYIPTQDEYASQIYASEVVLSDAFGTPSEDSNNEEGTHKININTATKEELMSVSGIGEVTADAIIEYRNSNGTFASIEDVMNVSGIGEGKFDKIRDFIEV